MADHITKEMARLCALAADPDADTTQERPYLPPVVRQKAEPGRPPQRQRADEEYEEMADAAERGEFTVGKVHIGPAMLSQFLRHGPAATDADRVAAASTMLARIEDQLVRFEDGREEAEPVIQAGLVGAAAALRAVLDAERDN